MVFSIQKDERQHILDANLTDTDTQNKKDSYIF